MSGNLSDDSLRRMRNGEYVFAVHGMQVQWGLQGHGRQRQRRNQDRRRAYSCDDPAQFSLTSLASPDNLMIAWETLRAGGGTAPGPDGRTFDDYSRSEAFALLRETSRDLLAGAYRPGPTRLCRVSKGDGRFRELDLGNIIDRVVPKALQRALAPIARRVAPHLRRSPWMIFAQMERIVRDQGLFTLVTDDIRDCYPSLRTEDVLDAHRPHLTQPDLFRLFETLVRGHEGPDRVVGLDQGSPLSPTAAELTLHHLLDQTLDADGRAHPSLRYVDNLTYLERDAQAGHETLRQVREVLTPHELTLKGTDGGPVDLRDRGHGHVVLGIAPAWRGNELTFSIPETSYSDLADGLVEAWKTPNPPRRAQAILEGWLNAYGPAYTTTDANRVIRRILHVASQMGYREVNVTRLRKRCSDSESRWRELREGILHGRGTT